MNNITENIKNDILEIYNRNKYITNKTIKHNTIQKEVKELSKKYNYIGVKEYETPYTSYKTNMSRNGRIDVVWKDDNGNIFLVFEVDSSARPKSIIKLLNQNSKIKIWLWYGKKIDKVNKLIHKLDKNLKINYIFPNFN